MKFFYDHLKTVEVEKCKNAVPKLFLSGMDEEALWQQLELQNNFTIDKLLENTSTFLAMKYDTLKFDYRVDGEADEQEEEDEQDDEGEDDDGGWDDLEAGDEDLENEELGDEEEELDGEEEEEEEDEEDEQDQDKESPENDKEEPEDNAEEEEEPSNRRGRKGKVELDDDFFKLKELNAFLDEEDRKEMSKSKKKYADEEDDGDDIDLFQDLDAVDEDEDGAADLKFADFFEKPAATGQKKKKKHFRDDEESEEENEEDPDDQDRRVKFNLSQNEEFSDKEGGDDEQVLSEEDPDDPKSTHEERQDRLKKRIARLEEKSMGDKPWQLKGEVRATSRPENSLLEEYVEFDSATRPAPLITEETTQRLDDIILQRIKDRAYDDVERKVRPSDNQNEFRKQLVLDQAKSKESLAQIYEKDFLDKVEAQKEKDTNVLDEEPAIKKEIREKMRQLMAKLDALSNYHFTPKPAAPEIKIITNTQAIEMEEAAPVAVSDATLLAPEEVKRPDRGDIIGRSERTKTDKNRERRRKKMKQRLTSNKETSSGKMSKESLEKVTKARNVQKVSLCINFLSL